MNNKSYILPTCALPCTEKQAKEICTRYFKQGINLQVIVSREVCLATDIWRLEDEVLKVEQEARY